MLKGDFKLPKRFRARVQVGQDRSGRPLYKWAEGNTKQELQLNISKVILEAGLLDGFVSQSSAKANSPTVESFIYETYIPTFMNGLSETTKANYHQYIAS